MTSRFIHYGALLLLVHLSGGCSQEAPSAKRAGGETAVNSQRTGAPAADAKLVVAFGDSLFAGYELPLQEGFAPALERALTQRGINAQVFNAGVSGDTSAAGRGRLAFVLDGLPRKPDLVIVGLGANDMLRGLSPEATRVHLEAILAELQRREIEVLLTGMLAAPNMGPDYAARFNAIYPQLAKTFDVPLYPFFLEGVAGQRELQLPDGKHPNAKGIEAVVNRVGPLVASQLAE